MIRLSLLSLILSLSALSLLAQEVKFMNPSFEGRAGANRLPRKWADCGFMAESPPDLHPDPARTFDVDLLPYEGRTYLGMVTRDNNTWEAVGAQLSGPLLQGQCYKFSIALTSSDSYRSMSRTTNVPVNYTSPIRLKIWGGNDFCDGQELLATSPVVTPGQWAVYDFVLEPRMNDYYVITLSADYPDDTEWATNGNLLLDAASSFEPLASCDDANTTLDEATKTLITLRLPEAEFFSDQENQRVFITNILRDFRFLEDGSLVDKRFQLEGESRIRQGAPQLYALMHAVQYDRSKKWELVVYDDDDILQELKLLNFGAVIPGGPDVSITILPYQPELHDGISWYCMSFENGLYMRLLE